MTSDAGWAKPKNNSDRAHWWRPDGRRACDPENPMIYTGPKQDTPTRRACAGCMLRLALVTEGRELLGVSDE